jgi:RNA recognition motif-containing protein
LLSQLCPLTRIASVFVKGRDHFNDKKLLDMNIFIAKLSSGTNGKQLGELFSKFGEVTSAKVVTDRVTGLSKRYGFVEMPDEQAAYEAIDKLNDTELDGSQIVVKIAIPKSGKNPEVAKRS